MNDTVLWLLLVVAVVNAALLIYLVLRQGRSGSADPLRNELRLAREEAAQAATASRQELTSGVAAANQTLAVTLKRIGDVQREQLSSLSTDLKTLSESNHQSLERVRATLDARVGELQTSNEKKLEDMRKTVDEKLQTTLERRLGESFKLVSDQLYCT
jgi:DNA recombination protein RmuC